MAKRCGPVTPSPRPSDDVIHVIDGTAALFRAHFGGSPLTDGEGAEVGALVGMAHWLVSLVSKLRPKYGVVVFDTPGGTFRKDRFGDYKAKRKPPPPELTSQFGRSRELAEHLGFCCFAEVGYEADDLMATIDARARKAGRGCVLVSPDKDILQLVDDRTTVFDPKSFERIDAEAVFERFSVHPHQMVDFQALCGDSSDNIPGVPGVGPKLATALLARFETLDGVYENLDVIGTLDVRGAKTLADKLTQHRELAELSRELATLHRSVPLSADPMRLSDLRYRGPSEGAPGFFDGLGHPAPLMNLRRLAGQR